MKGVLLFYITFLLLAFCNIAKGQEEDFQSWWRFELDGELFDILDFEVSPEIRFIGNTSDFRSVHADIDLSAPLTKFFRLGSQYRLQEKYYKEGYSYTVNRLGLYGKFDYKIHRFRLDYRALYQWEYVGYNTREYGYIPYQEHRHKISASYYRKRWDLRPQVSCEFFFLHKPDFVLSKKKYRLSFGLSYKLSKDVDFDISYRFQNEFFETNPLQANIIALRMTYEL